MDNLSLLTHLGLNDKEIIIYKTLAILGPLTPSVIAKETRIKRPSTYFSLGKLIEKGLISKGVHPKKEIYQAENPDTLIRIAKNAVQQAKSVEHAVKKLVISLKKSNKSKNNFPSIKMVEGKEGLWSIAEDTLNQREPIYAFGSSEELYKFFPEKLLEDYGKRRKQKHIKTFVLTEKHPESVKDYFRQDPNLTLYRFLPENVKIDTYLLLYGNKTAMATSINPPSGLIIDNQTITSSIKVMFHALWEQMEGKNLPKAIEASTDQQ